MSSINKENAEKDKKKKSRPRLSIKIFGGNSKKRDNMKKINEEFKSQDGSYNSHSNDAEQKPMRTKEAKEVAEVAKDETDDKSESDTSEEAVVVAPPVLVAPLVFRPGRRRSLSACADVQDTRIKIRSKDDDQEEEEVEEEDQLSPLPCTPTKSCIRGRSATISYSGEDVVTVSRPRSVSFSPEVVDPPPRTIKYRAWIEARLKAPPINVKHEKHKQKMNQLKKVNMSDYLASRKPASGTGLLASSTSAFGGGGIMM